MTEESAGVVPLVVERTEDMAAVLRATKAALRAEMKQRLTTLTPDQKQIQSRAVAEKVR
jgi:hypothetical protein